ncbi:MAG: SLC13 family permease [Pseudomonadota bacterium]|jgi:DASS family divalent anion:Na+ symporter|nr:anion permease [Alphaproteobacteria bacterium]
MESSITKNNYEEYLSVIGWLLSIVVPTIVYFFIVSTGTTQEIAIFSAILSAAIIMWIFKLVREYLPGILVVITCASLGLVPTNVVLAGFSSETFIMVFSVLVITVLIARSNLISRFMLNLLKKVPKETIWYDAVFFMSFAFLTPLIPSVISRTHLVGKFAANVLDMFGVRKHEACVVGTVTSCFFGASLFSNTFLSASLMNFIILALLPLQEQLQFQLMGWAKASIVALIVMLVAYSIGYLILQRILFKDRQLVSKGNQSKQSITQEQNQLIDKQLKSLGPISKDEWLSMATLAAFFIGMITFPYHKISPAWIAFSLVYMLLAFNIITREELLSKIDWPFLLFMASIIGISAVINYFNISELISSGLRGYIFDDSPGFLFTFFVLVTILVRFFLPIGATITLLIPVFITLSGLYGVTAWAACFTCLMVTDMWFFKYQCIFYTPMTDVLDEAGISYEEKNFQAFNIMANIVRIIGIVASFYYWRWISL